MSQHRVKLAPKGRLVLRLGDGEVRVSSPAAAVRQAQRAVRPYLATGRSMADELVAERREESARA